MTRTRALILALLLAPLIVLGSLAVAQAAIPDSTTGVISACYKTSNGDVTRFIDAEVGATCPSGQTQLDWNQTGPQGPAGPECIPGEWVELTLNPGYNNFETGHQHASVREECNGSVRIVGLLIGTNVPGTIATLPEEFRPEFVRIVNSAGITANPNGNLLGPSCSGGCGIDLYGTYAL